MGQICTKVKLFCFKLLVRVCLPILNSSKNVFEIIHSSELELEERRLQVLESDLKFNCLWYLAGWGLGGIHPIILLYTVDRSAHHIAVRIFQFLIRDIGQSLLEAVRNLLTKVFGFCSDHEEVQIFKLTQEGCQKRERNFKSLSKCDYFLKTAKWPEFIG